MLNTAAQFAIAYYFSHGTDSLNPPLHLLRYDRKTLRWYHRDFGESTVKTAFQSALERSRKPNMIEP